MDTFAEILFAKSFWWEIHQSFPPLDIHAIMVHDIHLHMYV